MKYFPPQTLISALQPIDMVFSELNENLSGRVLMVHISENENISEMLLKLANHKNSYLITKVNTDTNLFQNSIFTRAHSICFLHGRVKFLNEFHVPMKKASPFPVCIVAFGQQPSIALYKVIVANKINGTYIPVIRRYNRRKNDSENNNLLFGYEL